MRNRIVSRRLISSVPGIIVMLSLTLGTFFLYNSARAAELSHVTLPNSAARWVSSAHLLSHHASNDQITIGLMLKTMSVDQQKALVASLYHPKSSSYHQWLSSTQFSQSVYSITKQHCCSTGFLDAIRTASCCISRCIATARLGDHQPGGSGIPYDD